MNFRLFLSTLTAVVAALVNAQTGTSISIHSDSDSGRSSISWALIRVSHGGVATVGDLGGIHIGEITHDDLFIVRDGKAYEVRDESILKQVESTSGPVDKIREQRQKIKTQWREAHQQERTEERQRRNIDRSKQRVERNLEREGDTAKTDAQRQLAEMDRQMAEIDRQVKIMTEKIAAEQKRVDEISKTLDGARSERNKKVEAILSDAIAKGVAKPYP